MIDIYLQPGEYYVGDARYRIRTVLGSCVSITLWQPQRKVGAMSHFLLANRGVSLHPRAAELDARYADEAFALMLRGLAEMNVKPAACQAKLFGGGNMFPNYARSEIEHVGQRNGEAARELLAAHHIPIVSEALFGVGHRQIIFDVSTGDVWSRQVKPKPSSDSPKLADEEEGKKP